jgi:hypothetical protein
VAGKASLEFKDLRFVGTAFAQRLLFLVVLVFKPEHVEEIPDGRAVFRHIGIIFIGDWVRQIITAAGRNRRKVPVPFDKLQKRDMVVVGVIDKALLGETTISGMRAPSPKKSSG